MRVHISQPQRAAAGGFHSRQRAGFEGRERRALHVHFIAENPQMTRTQAAILAFLQDQRRQLIVHRDSGGNSVAGCYDRAGF